MDDILTHERFNRPKVVQPCPKRRKGTLNFRQARARKLAEGRTREPIHIHEPTDEDIVKARDLNVGKDWVRVFIDGDIQAIRLMRALQTEGLVFTGGVIIDASRDRPDGAA